MSAARKKYDGGERDAESLRTTMREVVSFEPLAQEQYISAADPETLEELRKIDSAVLLSLAVRIGKTRLIDNFLI